MVNREERGIISGQRVKYEPGHAVLWMRWLYHLSSKPGHIRSNIINGQLARTGTI